MVAPLTLTGNGGGNEADDTALGLFPEKSFFLMSSVTRVITETKRPQVI